MTKAVDSIYLIDFFFRKKKKTLNKPNNQPHIVHYLFFNATNTDTNYYKNDIFIENAAYLHIFIEFFDTSA